MENSMASNTSEAVESFELTKREATLLVHIGEHFPTGFTAEDLAVSLGWNVEEIHDALQVCAVHGLIEAPPDIEVPAVAPEKRSPLVDLDDLLTPEEQDAARESKVPSCNKGWLALGEELAVLRALGAGKETGFTEAEAEAALEWASMARLRSLLLDLVLDGHVALLGPDGNGEMKFAAPDAEGRRVTGGRESATPSCFCPPLPGVTTLTTNDQALEPANAVRTQSGSPQEELASFQRDHAEPAGSNGPLETTPISMNCEIDWRTPK